MLLISISPALHAGSGGRTQCSAQVVKLIQELIALLLCSGQSIVSEVSVVHSRPASAISSAALCLVVTRIGHSTRLSSYAEHNTDTTTLAVGEGFPLVTAKVKIRE